MCLRVLGQKLRALCKADNASFCCSASATPGPSTHRATRVKRRQIARPAFQFREISGLEQRAQGAQLRNSRGLQWRRLAPIRPQQCL